METLMNFTICGVSCLIWVVWILIGLFEALVATRVFGNRRILFMDAVVGIVFACLGGYLSTCFLGSTPMQLFLISILGAIFFSAAALWLIGVIFYKDEEKMP